MRTFSIYALATLINTSVWAQALPISETAVQLNLNYLNQNGMLESLKKAEEAQRTEYNYHPGGSTPSIMQPQTSHLIENYIALKQGAPLPYSLQTMETGPADILKAVKTLNAPNPTSNYLKIGVFLPINGPLKNISANILSSIQMALFELQNNNVLVYVYDIGSSDDQAFKATTLAKQDGINVALGPIRADQANFVKSVLKNIPMISFTNTETALRKDLYSISYLPHDQITAITDHTLSSGHTKVSSFIAHADPVQKSLSDEFIKHIQSSTYNQAFVHPTWSYDASTNNNKNDIKQFIKHNEILNAQLSLIEALSATEVLTEEENTLFQELQNDNLSSLIPFESLFLPVTPKDAKTLSHQLAFYDIEANKTQVFGLYSLANLVGRKDFPSSLSGMILPTPNQKPLNVFEKKFKDTTGKTAKNLDVLAYDAIHILNEIALISDGKFSQEILERPSGFWGYGGAVKFLDNGKNIRKYGISKISRRNVTQLTEVTGLATHKTYETQPKRNPFFGGGDWDYKKPKKQPERDKKSNFYIEWF